MTGLPKQPILPEKKAKPETPKALPLADYAASSSEDEDDEVEEQEANKDGENTNE